MPAASARLDPPNVADAVYALRNVHVTGAILLLLCVAGHVALNWNWIKANFLKKSAAAE